MVVLAIDLLTALGQIMFQLLKPDVILAVIRAPHFVL
jgi:hypothetical protein